MHTVNVVGSAHGGGKVHGVGSALAGGAGPDLGDLAGGRRDHATRGAHSAREVDDDDTTEHGARACATVTDRQ